MAGGLNLSWLILNEEFCSLSKSLPANAGSVLEKVTSSSSTRTSVSWDKSATILHHLWNISATLQFGLGQTFVFSATTDFNR